MTLELEIIERLRSALHIWGLENIQSYSWRHKTDPYSIIVAEFMLHRTQVVQVQKVYDEFVSRYSCLKDVVTANRYQLIDSLRPLGLMWRVNLMIEALHYMWKNYAGIPENVETLLQVPGVGPYIAGATVCFSRNRRVPLVDTNTVRVTGRVFGLDISGEARRRRQIIHAIEEACDPENPRDYYYAMIDLAHTICHPQKPECYRCPLKDVPCHYTRKQNMTDNLVPEFS